METHKLNERMIRLGEMLPSQLVAKLGTTARQGGVEVDARELAGKILGQSLVGTVLGGILGFAAYLNVLHAILGCGIGFIFVFGLRWYLLDAKAESRARQVETVLPDALESVASNIKSGMTTEKALFVSARPEFGALADGLKTAGRKILAGIPVGTALMEITLGFRSGVLSRTVDLLVQGIQSGGEIANLLLRLGTDLREEAALQKETQANISMYVGLIFITAAFGAPMLFGISTVIVGTISEQLAATSGNLPNLENLPSGGPLSGLTSFVSGSTTQVTPAFIEMFSLLALVLTAISASLTMGVIQSGNPKDGIRSIPMILIISLVLFFVVKTVLGQIVGSAAKFL